MYRIKTLRLALVTMVAFSSGLVFAQSTSTCEAKDAGSKQTIAELRNVQGNVLVSDAAGMSSATVSQRVANKTRVTTTAQAGVTVAFDCGCDVTLKENERFDVTLPASCPALLASITPAMPAVALGAPAAAATTTGSLLPAGIVTGVGVGAYLLYRSNRDVSPSR